MYKIAILILTSLLVLFSVGCEQETTAIGWNDAHPTDYSYLVTWESVTSKGNDVVAIAWVKPNGYKIENGVLYLDDWYSTMYHKEKMILSSGTKWRLEER